jgi:hypothetical protein
VAEQKRRRGGAGKGGSGDRKTFLLRLSPELMEEMKIWSNQEFRSLNGQIEFLLQSAINQRKRGGRKTEDTAT